MAAVFGGKEHARVHRHRRVQGDRRSIWANQALLYVRQSTLKQVIHNAESAHRQYDLRGRAIALGWTDDQISVIDIDQGHSGASAADREGFQHLVAEVSLGRAGIVLGLECSRLARNSADWHRLLELCAMTGTLICDEDGLYDPRLQRPATARHERPNVGGRTAFHQGPAARRGAVQGPPRRADHAAAGRSDLRRRRPCHARPRRPQCDTRCGTCSTPSPPPDRPPPASRRSVRPTCLPLRHPRGPTRASWTGNRCSTTPCCGCCTIPATPARSPTAATATRNCRQRQVVVHPAAARGVDLVHPRRPPRLHHPRGVRRQPRPADRQRRRPRPRPRRRAAARGPALLQGIIICGRCGKPNDRALPPSPRPAVAHLHVSTRRHRQRPTDLRQPFPAPTSTSASGSCCSTTSPPLAVEAALTVSAELQQRAADADRMRAAHVERAHYHADLARRRYLAVDPANRLVADSLEADWNTALRALDDAQQTYDKARQQHSGQLTDAQRARISQLVTDLPAIWNDPDTPAAGTQTHRPAAAHRRHHPPRQRHHHRACPLLRRPTHHAHPARPQTRWRATQNTHQGRRRRRRTARRHTSAARSPTSSTSEV